MSATAEKIRLELAGLDEADRAELAHFLIQSLDHGGDEGAEAAWDAEIRDRIRAIAPADSSGNPADSGAEPADTGSKPSDSGF